MCGSRDQLFFVDVVDVVHAQFLDCEVAREFCFAS